MSHHVPSKYNIAIIREEHRVEVCRAEKSRVEVVEATRIPCTFIIQFRVGKHRVKIKLCRVAPSAQG